MSIDPSEILERSMEKDEINLYSDSPRLYDVLYRDSGANRQKENSVRRNIDESTEVLDLACGTGIVTERIADDFEVTGADLSREMLKVADRKEINADFVQTDMRYLPFSQDFDAVIMYGQPLSHLENQKDVRSTAESIYDSLKPEGVFITDFFSEDAGLKESLNPIMQEFGDYTAVMSPEFSSYDRSAQAWDASIEFQVENGEKQNRFTHSRGMRGYSIDRMEEILEEAGFSTVMEQEIYGGPIHNSVVAYKQEETGKN